MTRQTARRALCVEDGNKSRHLGRNPRRDCQQRWNADDMTPHGIGGRFGRSHADSQTSERTRPDRYAYQLNVGRLPISGRQKFLDRRGKRLRTAPCRVQSVFGYNAALVKCGDRTRGVDCFDRQNSHVQEYHRKRACAGVSRSGGMAVHRQLIATQNRVVANNRYSQERRVTTMPCLAVLRRG